VINTSTMYCHIDAVTLWRTLLQNIWL